MRGGVRRPGVGGVLREGALDLRAGGCVVAVLGQRHAVVGGEPGVVAVVRGEAVQQGEQVRFWPARPELPIRPLVKAVVPRTRASRGHSSRWVWTRGQGGFGVAGDQQGEIGDVAGFAGGRLGGEGVGGGYGLARRGGVAAFQQRVGAGGVREGEGGVGCDGAVEGVDGAGVHGQFGLDSPGRRRRGRRARWWRGGGYGGLGAWQPLGPGQDRLWGESTRYATMRS